ncbi:MAG: DsrE family protein [Proteobacteria bacterium]|nr:DsrE family protein [Pseudomonadota bacterium]MCH8198347.1 DsrE family protein [Pseudomonadota bacterium]
MVGNVLVNCAYGKNNPEEATVAFIAASAAVTRSTATAVFLTSDAVRLATPGYADGVQADGYEPLKVFLDKFLEDGGKLWVCPACAKARDMTQDDLIGGATIDGVPTMLEFLDNGGITLM